MSVDLTGEVVRDVDVATDYPNLRELEVEAVHTFPRATWRRERMCSFDVDDVLVTSGFLPIDLARGRLFLNQSYGGIETLTVLGFRPRLEDGRYALTSDPLRHSGPHVLIGGPIDDVWYHWLYNWAPRLLLLRKLRPELWSDPGVRFIVQTKAMNPQFRAVLEAFGVPPARMTVVDLARDHRFERVTLLPFLHQDLLFPDLLREFAALLGSALAGRAEAGREQDLFLSRQALPAPKRRVDNFEDLAPVLVRHGVRVIDCAVLTAGDQARAFRGAARVLAGHGSDLANLMFCRPSTQVLVFEHAASLSHGRHVLLRELCRLFGLRYDVMIPFSTSAPEADIAERLRADYRIDPAAVDAWLAQPKVAEALPSYRPPTPRAQGSLLGRLLARGARTRGCIRPADRHQAT